MVVVPTVPTVNCRSLLADPKTRMMSPVWNPSDVKLDEADVIVRVDAVNEMSVLMRVVTVENISW